MFQEFRAFIARGNVIDLAVGIIIGAAFTSIVDSLVKDIIMPPIGVVLGGIDFSDFYINLSGTPYPSLAAAKEAGAATINYGVFINACIKFLIVAFAVFILVKQVNRIHKKPPPPPPSISAEVKLLTEIRDLMKARTD
ncbi:large conductance mechanosensitive channel [Stella humosa]|uniref:Large-conductance mechanosensitive channel n=1 Tax=Stella humosa TaxID=94 RepID=A0A3N1KVP0_9PROT|nr:large conductance mechanosensitive channel protein MscL [Stella humosa]ROP83317.1 large conductance mechanosensitive channel [Stella humosa]BBK29900.1 large-conductance mechanosensitive channel [Stella humosa]